MKHLLLAASLGMSAATLAAAQDAETEDLRAAAEAYVNNPVQQDLFEDMLSTDMIMAQMAPLTQNLPESEVQTLAQIVSEEVQAIRPEMEAAMVEGAVDTFTIDELEALNAFYSSEDGASVMRKMTPFMQSYMTSLGPTIQAMQRSIMTRVEDEIEP